MAANVLSHFSCLDELIQVIYQGIDTFVAISTVSEDEDEWAIHLSCEGRWWQGKWTSQDVLKIVGPTPSDFLLEQFAENLAGHFVQGQLSISDWDPEPNAAIKFIVSPASKKPMYVPLEEMSEKDGALYSASVFKEIAVQAQSRKCHMHGGAEPSFSSSALPSSVRPSVVVPSNAQASQPTASSSNAAPKKPEAKASTSSNPKKRILPGTSVATDAHATKSQPPRPKVAGASLANPNKKARRVQVVELGSDSDDD